MYVEMVIIALIVVGLLAQFILARIYARIVRESVFVLDQNIAGAIKTALEGLPEALQERFGMMQEQPNPVQLALGELIRKQMNPQIVAKEVTQGEDGKFT